MKLASYAKLCSGFEASPGPASEQVGAAAAATTTLRLAPALLAHVTVYEPTSLTTHPALCVLYLANPCTQLAKTKAADIESLLQQLSDINHDMSGVIAGAGDARSHTLARHRDILTDLTQVRGWHTTHGTRATCRSCSSLGLA